MSEPTYPVPAQVARPPAPGEESAGPPTSELVLELRSAVRAELALLAQARLEALEREILGLVAFNSDGSGNGFVELAEVPGGATGYLTWLTVDVDGSTPATPTTSGTLWLAVYAGAQGARGSADVAVIGSLLDCQPATPAADAQIPAVFSYGARDAAPALVGPGTFYVVVASSAASKLHVCRFRVVLVQPEP